MLVGVLLYQVLHVSSVSLVQKLLREEMSQLRQKVDHHPEVTRYAMECMELKSEWAWLEGWAGHH